MKNEKAKLLLPVLILVFLFSSICVYALTPNGVSIASATVYTTATGSTVYGSIGVNENVQIGSTSGSRTYITYKTSSIDKSGYVSSSAVKSTGWQWPVEALTKTQEFNSPSGHLGIDMTSSVSDDTIRCPFDGTIKYAGSSSGNGNHVIIQHTVGSATFYSLYCHLNSYGTNVAAGNSISKGAAIGIMGSTGNSTGKHLHFSFFDKYYSTDPYGYTTSGGSVVSSSNNKIVMKYSNTVSVKYYNPEYVIRNNGATP